MASTTIPTKDTDFNVAQEVISTEANTNRTAWGLDTSWLDSELLPAKAVWVAAYAAYENPATRTPLLTFEKTEARKKYEKLLRVLVANLEANTKVTDDDRRAMGIPIRKTTRTPVPVPATYPDFDVDSSVIRRLTIHFRDHGSDKKAKPAGVHGAEIRWAILAAPPVEVSELVNTGFDTHTPFTLEFNESERGQTVWFCLRWENTRGEKGPWSEIVSAIIP
ncbi:MAG: hypothetical protein LBQ28_04340 [Prevotellaceae bacterium]|jgi:hypothetical protein|nr:hypothetical protein [Prevotellaceae bacterium]